MPIIILILSSLAFWGLYWFLRMGGLAHMREAAARRKDAERLARARESQHRAPLHAVDDPRDAAMVLMLLMARVNGDPTREHVAKVEEIARATFGFDRELAERMTQARFIASRAVGFEQAAALFSELLRMSLTRDERRELVTMVEEVAAVEGPTPAQNEAATLLAQRVGLIAPF